MPNKQVEIPRRFLGIAKLYGFQGLAKFQRSHIIVIGIGGVGSWVAEALVRSGVGKLTLIDMDHISESNINRQLHALNSNLGMAKVAALANRLSDINPECEVHCIDDFVASEQPEKYLGAPCDFVIDCIDYAITKAAIIAYCKREKTKIITVGGAGGKTNPTKITQGDLSNTTKDSLLSRTRKILRQQYSFSRNVKRSFCVPAVYSTQQPVAPHTGEARIDTQAGLNCAGFGSAAHLTASLGFVAVDYVLQKLADDR